MTFKLREYQEECLTFTDLALRKYARVANVLPTGAGKTVIFSAMAKRHLEAVPDGRVLILVHTDELVQQAFNKVRAMCPGVEVGIVKAERNDVDARVIVASVQTLRQYDRRKQVTDVSLLIVDEAHHGSARTYTDIIEHYTREPGERCPSCEGHGSAFSEKVYTQAPCKVCSGRGRLAKCRVVGFTATLARSDEGDLSKVWQHVAYRRDILWMIRNEFLIDVRGVHVRVDDLDLKKVKKSGGDFQKDALGQALSDSMAPEVVARALKQHGPDRQTICFTPLVSSAYEFEKAFLAGGFTAETVHGALPKSERRAILARYASGETQVICNAMVLTEGFDAPATSCVIVARPTKSKPLFQQMVGRGLRVDPEKPWAAQDCLLLMVAGAEMHDLRSLVDLTEKQLKPKPEQSLLEAEDEAESEGAARDVKPTWKGPVKYKEFDPLLRASRRTWSHTAGTRTRYLAAGDVYVVLRENAETAGAWDVCWASKTARQQGVTEYTGIPLDLAMDWGEDVADRMGGEGSILNTKGKTWRRARPSENQLKFAAKLKIEVRDEWRKGDLAEAIDTVMASRRIDPMITQYRKYLEQRESEGS